MTFVRRDILTYLNSSSTRTLLHTDPLPARFEAIAFDLSSAFARAGDEHRQSAPHLEALLERGVRVLVYAGMYDLACSWLANERMTRGLEWSGQKEFASQELEEWQVDGKIAGHTRFYGPLTFATFQGAGHMVRS
jgi:carboxypeptidase C (cathepsin A)